MTKEMKNESTQNNSMHTSTPNCESVEILFGLTPHQLYYAAGWFFDFPRMCSVALMEMLDAIQEQSKKGEDTSTLISYLKTMRVLVKLEKLMPVYNELFQHVDSNANNADWLNVLDSDTDNTASLREIIMSLHYSLLDIVNGVDKMGYVDFQSNCAGSFSDITTKAAYDDIVVAFACINSLYVAYTKNRYHCMSAACFNTHKNIN